MVEEGADLILEAGGYGCLPATLPDRPAGEGARDQHFGETRLPDSRLSLSVTALGEGDPAIGESEQANACYAQNLAEYLYGRVVTSDSDNQLVEQGGWLSHDKESVQNLIVNLLATDAFLTRLP